MTQYHFVAASERFLTEEEPLEEVVRRTFVVAWLTCWQAVDADFDVAVVAHFGCFDQIWSKVLKTG